MKKTVTILGAGAWGTSLATLFAHNGFNVVMWCYEESVAAEITTAHTNTTYFAGFKLLPTITATNDIAYALAQSDWIIEVIPVAFMRSVLERVKHLVTPKQVWIIASKGIEQNTMKLPSQILDDIYGPTVNKVVLAGPNFAQELAACVPTATVLASSDEMIARKLGIMLAGDYFKPYVNSDVIGVQVGGAFKNVLALAVGIAKGLNMQENTIAYLLTRGLHEMGVITNFYKGKHETVYGLSGLGDMILTCTGTLSKNLNVGRLLGQGTTLEQIKAAGGTLPEGLNTVQSVHQLMQRHNLDLPLCRNTYEFIFGQRSQPFLKDLWSQVTDVERW
jgi:glycerol-3-phosphate dehydrogenase (NAD(P)+)